MMRFLPCLAVLLGLLPRPAAAGPEQPVSTTRPLSVRMAFPDSQPFMELDQKTGQPSGPIVRRVNKIGALAQIDIHWDGAMSRRDVLALLSSDTPACSPNLLWTPERASHYQFSAPLFEPPVGWWWATLVLTGANTPTPRRCSPTRLASMDDFSARPLGPSWTTPRKRPKSTLGGFAEIS